MANFQTVPIKYYVVKNDNTGNSVHCLDFDVAEDILIEKRNESDGDGYLMYAVIDA